MYKSILLCGLIMSLPQVALAAPKGKVECHLKTDGEAQVHEAFNGNPITLKADGSPKIYNEAYFNRVCKEEFGEKAEARVVRI